MLEGILEGIIIRKGVEEVEDPSQDFSALFNINFGQEYLQDFKKYEVPRGGRYMFRPLAPGQKDYPPEEVTTMIKDTRTVFPPLRFSVNFHLQNGIGDLAGENTYYSNPIFYAGSWWAVWLKRDRPDFGPDLLVTDRVAVGVKRIPHPGRTRLEGGEDFDYKGIARRCVKIIQENNKNCEPGEQVPLNEKAIEALLCDSKNPFEHYRDKRENVLGYFKIQAHSAILGYDTTQTIIIDGKEIRKYGCPAVAKTTIYETGIVSFGPGKSLVVPGRAWIPHPEEAQEFVTFADEFDDFQNILNHVRAQNITALDSLESPFTKYYRESGKARTPEAHEAIKTALADRDSIWSNVRLSVVIGII